MFKSEEMQRIRAYGEKTHVGEIVEGLYEFGAIHVTQANQNCIKQYGKTLDTFKEISAALIAIRSVENTLGLKEAKEEMEMPLSNLLTECSKAGVYEFIKLGQQREKLESEQKELQNKLLEVKPFAVFKMEKEFQKVKSISFTLFETTANYSAIQQEFSKVQNTSVYFKEEKAMYCLVVFDVTKGEAIEKIIQKHAARIFQAPEIESLNFEIEAEKLNEKINAISQQLSEIKKEMQRIKEKNGEKIAALRKALEIESRKAQLPFDFGATNKLIAIEGWVPRKIANQLEEKLRKKVENVHVELLKTNELPPTKLVNPKPLNSFEELVKFFSLPKSTELDPTPLVAISFPLFFGMIVGDIGYGLVSLLLAMWIKSKFKDNFLQSLGTMLAVSAVSSIVFGVIFAEFFGFEHILGFEMHPLIHRIEAAGLETLMAFVILFGMIHLAVGYLLGSMQAFKHGSSKHGFGKLSWLLLEISLALYFAGTLEIPFLRFVQPAASVVTPQISGPLIALSIIGIFITEGITALFEIFGLISNVFSYLRIMALGVSGVIIALILNKIPESVSFATPVAAITSILLLALYVAGHLAGIALALFESMIQSMRLQYVEFFSKFFEGGGVPFIALNSKKKY